MNALANHPIAGQSHVLKLFLGLQDDIGTAWAEVSNNALTRLGAVGVGVSVAMADKLHDVSGDWETNAELLALQSSESVRMAAVAQAVPKLEGTVTLLRDQGDPFSDHVGMELSKLAKQQQINRKMKMSAATQHQVKYCQMVCFDKGVVKDDWLWN